MGIWHAMHAIKLPRHRLGAVGMCQGHSVCDSLKPHCCSALHATACTMHHLIIAVLFRRM